MLASPSPEENEGPSNLSAAGRKYHFNWQRLNPNPATSRNLVVLGSADNIRLPAWNLPLSSRRSWRMKENFFA